MEQQDNDNSKANDSRIVAFEPLSITPDVDKSFQAALKSGKPLTQKQLAEIRKKEREQKK